MFVNRSLLKLGMIVGCLSAWLATAGFAIGAEAGGASAESSTVLWYRQPAKDWLEALPVGNGRLGAMVFGGIGSERIQLNEESLWTGGRAYPVPSGAYKSFPEIRRLLFDGKYAEAEALVRSTMLVGRGEGNT